MVDSNAFGEFFKQRRLALGRKLREFCREHQLDAGNISRIERGLLPPPRNQETLRLYARALHLEANSRDSAEFYRLATGRIPEEILNDQSKLGMLDAIRQRQPIRVNSNADFSIVGAVNLEQWADTLDARSRLPQAIRRLVYATTLSQELVVFPAGEGIQRPGLDGVVKTNAGNAFVPTGISGWELGVDRDIAAKANREFNKRTNNPNGLVLKEASFIFVTLRRWVRKDAWCKEKNRLGAWKDVRAYDSDNLEQWLEIAPSVSIWLATLLGNRPPAVEDAGRHWESVSSLVEPRFTTGVFLASRAAAQQKLGEWLNGPARALAFASRSPVEVIDFFCAYLASLDDNDRERFQSRSILVESRQAWDILRGSRTPLVMVAKPQLNLEAEMISSAVQNGHHVLVSATHFSTPRVSVEPLPRVYQHDLEVALRECGFGEADALKAARASGGSVTILKRHLTRTPDLKYPAWSAAERAPAATPFLWVGAWDSRNEADRAIVERFARQPYEAVEQHAMALTHCDEPLLMHAAGCWGVLSKDDAWMLAGRFATEPQFRAFEAAADEVLGENDPKFDLPTDRRWCAVSYDQSPRFSQILKQSIAETLALLASLPDALQIPTTWNVPARVDSIVQKLLPRNASWKRWASLSDFLPLLAEASPDAFLRAVETDLRCEASELVRLFEEQGDAMTGGCYHAGLLFAVELIAWSPNYLTRACRVLLDLDERAPSGNWANKPANTLEAIFSPWYPQTTATVQQRLQVIDGLVAHRRESAWPFLLSLLPDVSGGFALPIQMPRWRSWATTWSPGATNREYWEQVEATSERLITQAGLDTGRWCDLIKNVERFPQASYCALLEGVGALVSGGADGDAAKRLADTIREKVHRHRAYSTARWALPAEFVDSLEGIQTKLEPRNAALRYDWLFEQWPERYQGSEGESWEDQQAALVEKRREALAEVLAESGIDGVCEMARRAKSPQIIGEVLAIISGDQFLDPLFPQSLLDKDEHIRTFAAGFVWVRFHSDGWNWVSGLHVAAWPFDAAARLFAWLPFNREVWARVEELGIEASNEYWRIAPPFNPRLESNDVEFVVRKLVEHCRPIAAIDLLGMALHNKRNLAVGTLFQALEQLLGLPKEEISQGLRNIRHDIQQLFEHLQDRKDSDENRLCSLEWKYLPFLDRRESAPRALHRWLSRDPAFFVEVLSLVYRSRKHDAGDQNTGKDQNENEDHEATIHMAEQGYRLLHSWRTVPGIKRDGRVDPGHLSQWVKEAREQSELCGRLEVCDATIGQIFAGSPSEGDGTWPCAAVRQVMETVRSERLSNGFYVGIRNLRGVTARAPHAGGALERQEAEKYESLASKIEFDSPWTAEVLRKVAESYREQARREDEEAEWRV